MLSIGFFIQAFFLGLALSMDCFTVSITCGLQKTLSKKRTLLMAFFFAFFQALMPLIGSVFSSFAFDFLESMTSWISFALLFIIGLKMFLEGRNYKLKEKVFDVSSMKVILLLSIATSIDALIVGISFVGMGWVVGEQLLAIVLIFVITFIMSLTGVKTGEKVNFIKPPFALITGGLILILIGVKTILQHYITAA
ncbi:MAG: manganese efflux pump [Bacteroidales bacterium]|nr:manganese efflux pump [Bacteroidales bacterium]